MRKDITSRKDIELFVTQFYNKLLADTHINHFFEDIRKENTLKIHLKTIADFWQDILLGTTNYGKNAMKPHLELNKSIEFKKEHFKIWLHHFNTTINSLFSGEKAEIAKQRAQSIATIMQIKLSNNESN